MGCGIAKRITFPYNFRTKYKRFILHSIVPHSSYDPGPSNYDVILLKLQRPVDYQILPDVYPACWPTLTPSAGTVEGYFYFYYHTLSKHKTMSSRQLFLALEQHQRVDRLLILWKRLALSYFAYYRSAQINRLFLLPDAILNMKAFGLQGSIKSCCIIRIAGWCADHTYYFVW